MTMLLPSWWMLQLEPKRLPSVCMAVMSMAGVTRAVMSMVMWKSTSCRTWLKNIMCLKAMLKTVV